MNIENFFTSFSYSEEPPIVTPEVKQTQESYIELMNQLKQDILQSQNWNQRDILPEDWAQSSLEFKGDAFDNEYEDTSAFDESLFNQKNKNNSSTIAQKAVDIARQFVGYKYTWGGISPSTGFDCSGLGYYSFKQLGVTLPRTAKYMAKVGVEVPIDEVQKGDFIITKSRGPSGHHVVWVYGRTPDGKIKVVEAKGKKYGVVESIFNNYNNVIAVRRILDTKANTSTQSNSTDTKTSSRTTFTDKGKFVQTLNQAFKRALRKAGKDANLSLMLVAQDALECNWGKSVLGDNNFGNITTTGNDWHKKTGNHKWKDFKSIDDYAEYKVQFLDRARYRFYDLPNLNNIQQSMQILANRGYCPGSPNYGSSVARVYNTVLKYV